MIEKENFPDVENPAKHFKERNYQESISYLLGLIPANAEANTEWAARNFKAWADWQIAQYLNDRSSAK